MLLSLFALELCAQEVLKGRVTDNVTGEPVSNVYIMLMNKDGNSFLSHSFSQDDGAFSIELPKTEDDTFLITTSRIGYETFNKIISVQTQKIEILLKETAIQLREVKIKSDPIRQRGDTIDYFMSSFMRPQDRTLADVLARMPGIELQSDGRVQYEGKPINKFYIENMDLLEQRYSIATKNLSPNDIATVQVYENHEPVKMLRDRSNSEQAALNIKLKEGVKAKWLNTIDFGVGGFPVLYDASATLARFARSNQSMLVGKANNTGKDIFQELKMHTLKPGEVFRPGMPDGIPDQLYPLSIASSLFTRDRARFNESAIISLNQLWRVAEDKDLRMNINYGFEREERSRSIETQYLFENQPNITIKDNTSQTLDWHKLENEVAFTANRSSYFLEEKVNVNFHWKDASANILSNEYLINQKTKLPRTHFRNSTTLSKLIANTSIGITNNTEFTRLPQSLAISSEDDLPLFPSNRVQQDVLFNDGFSNTFFMINHKLRHQNIDLKVGAEWIWQDIESDLAPMTVTENHFANDLSWNTRRFYAEPSHKLNYKQWTITSSASANYMNTDYSGTKDEYFYINPRFRVVYEPNGHVKFNAGYSHNIRYGNLNQLQTGYVLKRYNLFSKGSNELQNSASHSITGGVFYKNTHHFFNLHYISSFLKYRNNLAPSSFIQDIYTFTWWEFRKNPSTFWMNTLSATKLFTDISLTAGLSLSYNQNKSTMQQQGYEVDYTNHSFDISPSLKWNAKSNLNFDYNLKALFSGVGINNKSPDNYIPLINHQLYTYLGITQKLSVTSNLQHFYNKTPNASVSNLVFADVGMQYQFNIVAVSLDWTNILNQKHQVVSSYSTINTRTQVDKLRPSEILISFRFKR